MEIAGISHLYYAADLKQSGKILARLPEDLRFPIDSENLRKECGKPVDARSTPSRQMRCTDALDIIAVWANSRSR